MDNFIDEDGDSRTLDFSRMIEDATISLDIGDVQAIDKMLLFLVVIQQLWGFPRCRVVRQAVQTLIALGGEVTDDEDEEAEGRPLCLPDITFAWFYSCRVGRHTVYSHRGSLLVVAYFRGKMNREYYNRKILIIESLKK